MEENIVDEIKARLDIVNVVGDYVALRKRGNTYLGLCPFHNEKTPSFSVSERGGFYHCFGCGNGGDIFKFVMEMENITFREALELLAARAGVEIPKSNFFRDDVRNITLEDDKKTLKEKIFEINNLATQYFMKCFFEDSGIVARRYAKERNITSEIIKEFKIGYCGDKLYEFLKSKGFLDVEIFASGLIYKRDDGRMISRFRGRLIFPIKDLRGNVIAFGGRNLEKNSKYAKYINSSDTPIYNKGNNLFALDIAKKFSKEQLIICEGYMDAISLHKAGIKNAIASLGTALTDMQANLIKTKTKEVLIAYDSDAAGTSATLRGMEILKKKGLIVKVINLKPVKDPDEYINKYGVDRFRERINDAEDLVEYKIRLANEKYDKNKVSEKIEFLKELSNIFLDIESDIERDVRISETARKYGINKESIVSEITRIKNNSSKDLKISIYKNKQILEEVENKKKEESKYKNNVKEELLIYLLLNNKNVFDKIMENFLLEDFENPINKKTVEYIYKIGKDKNISEILSQITEKDVQEKITKIGFQEYKYLDSEKTLNDILVVKEKEKLRKQKQNIAKKISDIKDKILEAEKLGNTKEVENLQKEKSKLEMQILEIINKIAKFKNKK